MEENQQSLKFEVNDRVKRGNGSGCVGVVREIREEVVGTVGDSKEKGLLVKVLWDNGVTSYFDPSALIKA